MWREKARKPNRFNLANASHDVGLPSNPGSSDSHSAVGSDPVVLERAVLLTSVCMYVRHPFAVRHFPPCLGGDFDVVFPPMEK